MCIRELPFLCSPTDRALERVDVHSFQIGSTGYFLLFQKVDRRTLGKRRSGGGGGGMLARGQEMFKIRDDLSNTSWRRAQENTKSISIFFSISLPLRVSASMYFCAVHCYRPQAGQQRNISEALCRKELMFYLYEHNRRKSENKILTLKSDRYFEKNHESHYKTVDDFSFPFHVHKMRAWEDQIWK